MPEPLEEHYKVAGTYRKRYGIRHAWLDGTMMSRDNRWLDIVMLAVALGHQTMFAKEPTPETRTPGSPGIVPVETFFRNFQYNELALSPDGKFLAALAPSKQRVGLVVIDRRRPLFS